MNSELKPLIDLAKAIPKEKLVELLEIETSISKEKLKNLREGFDIFYFNIDAVNLSSKDQFIKFYNSLSGSLPSDDMRQFFAAIIRFSVSGAALPIGVFPNNFYYVTLNWNGYTSGPILCNPPPGLPANAGTVTLNSGNFFNSYQDFLESINDAYASALTALKIAAGDGSDIADANPPFFLFNCETGLISLYAESAYYQQGNISPPPITIFMNYALYSNFNNFQVNVFGQSLPSYLDIQIRVVDKYGSNTASFDDTLLQIDAEGSNCTQFFSLQTIRFESVAMGFRPQLITTPNSTDNIQQTTSTSGIPSQQILEDLCPSYSSNEIIGNRAGSLVYDANYSYRLIDISKKVIDVSDISVYWTTQNGTTFPFPLPPNSGASMKIAFIRKSVVKNY